MAGVVLLSVPYTGTNFCNQIFAKAGYEVLGLHERAGRDKFLRSAHCVKDTQVDAGMMLVRAHYPLVVPLRHPYRVAESFKRKGLALTDMIRGFRNVMDRLAHYNPYYMPVDSPCREECLEDLRAIDPALSTDWKVVYSQSGTFGLDLNEIEPDPEVVKLALEMAPILDRFYDL
jgi:hypothetical protein